LVGEVQEFLTGAQNALPTERVLLTVLVTDIVGSTEKVAAIGDLEWKILCKRMTVSYDER
jgi:class 3 adenylate cyclase